MTATDKLRALLDERGIEHDDNDVNVEVTGVRITRWKNGGKRDVRYEEWRNGTTRLDAGNVSPEQAIAATVGNGTDLASRLREVTGLHAFAELFGFDWTNGSDWDWHDVACAMADAIDAAPAEPDEATMLKLHDRMNAVLFGINDELLALHTRDRENASSQKLIDCVIAAHQIIEDAATVGVCTCKLVDNDSGPDMHCTTCGGGVDDEYRYFMDSWGYSRCPHCGARIIKEVTE